jgi:PAS domain S-box-containing protein
MPVPVVESRMQLDRPASSISATPDGSGGAVATGERRWATLLAPPTDDRRRSAAIEDAIRAAPSARAAAEAACQLLGEGLGLAFVAVAEPLAADGSARIDVVWTRSPPSLGLHGVVDRKVDGVAAALRGETLTIDDLAATSCASSSVTAARVALGARAWAEVPLTREGACCAVALLADSRPRAWSAGDLALARTALERAWSELERTRAEAALRASETRLRLAAEAAQMFFWEHDYQAGRVTWGPTAAALIGCAPEALPAGAEDAQFFVDPAERGRLYAEFFELAARGAPVFRSLFRGVDGRRWEAEARIEYDADGAPARVYGVTRDVTERHASQERQRFLLELSDQLRSDGRAMHVTAEALGRHLEVSRAGYAIQEGAPGALIVETEWCDAEGDDAVGAHHLSDFGPWIEGELVAGRAVAVEDVLADPRTAPFASAYLAIDTRSLVTVPVLREGRLAATVYLNHRAPRRWRPDEIETVREVAERTWAAVERERAQSDLAASEARLRTVLEATAAIVWTADPRGRIVAPQPSWEAYTGQGGAAHVGYGWVSMLHSEDRPRIWRAAQATEARFEADGRLWHAASGRHRDVVIRGAALRDAAGATVEWIGAITDIDDRTQAERRLREAETALRASEARYRAVFERARVGLGRVSPDGLFLEINDRFCEILGRARDEVIGRSFEPFTHPDDLGADIANVERLRAGLVDSFTMEKRYLGRDGGDIWVSLTVVAVRAPDGSVAYFVPVVEDIRDRKAAEAALAGANRELSERVAAAVASERDALARLHESQKMETIGQLTGGVAHDFNNLLSAILANLDLARKRAQEPRVRDLLDGAVKAAERGAALTARLLAFARRQELSAEAVDIAALVEGMRDLLERAVGPGVRIATLLPPDLPAVRIDPNQLELALLNLVVNARDAMPSGGALIISAAAESLAAPDRRLGLAPGDYLRLCVADDGVGMDEETLRRAVEPFFTTKGVGKGTGLGLSMVQGLLAQSGGGTRLTSAPGCGTTVELWIPRAQGAAAAPARVAESAAPRPQSRLTVLVVDDDPLVAMGTVAMLEDLEHEALEASSGVEALAILAARPDVDVMITDHAMPGMTGVELAARASALRPSLPVALATGYAELPNGVDPGLPRLGKPFRQDELAATLAALARGAAIRPS